MSNTLTHTDRGKTITWTNPFFNVQHSSRDARGRYCSVTYGNGWAVLNRWYVGCGFNPLHSVHDSAEQARAAGEDWLHNP